MERTVRSAALLLATALLCAENARAETGFCVDLTVEQVRSAKGVLVVALFDDAQAYRDDKGEERLERVPAAEGTVHIRICGLDEGRHALSVFHDENANGALDTGFLGIPKEGYGFGNGERGLTGKPPFEDLLFELGPSSPERVENVRLHYYL